MNIKSIANKTFNGIVYLVISFTLISLSSITKRFVPNQYIPVIPNWLQSTVVFWVWLIIGFVLFAIIVAQVSMYMFGRLDFPILDEKKLKETFKPVNDKAFKKMYSSYWNHLYVMYLTVLLFTSGHVYQSYTYIVSIVLIYGNAWYLNRISKKYLKINTKNYSTSDSNDRVFVIQD